MRGINLPSSALEPTVGPGSSQLPQGLTLGDYADRKGYWGKVTDCEAEAQGTNWPASQGEARQS